MSRNITYADRLYNNNWLRKQLGPLKAYGSFKDHLYLTIIPRERQELTLRGDFRKTAQIMCTINVKYWPGGNLKYLVPSIQMNVSSQMNLIHNQMDPIKGIAIRNIRVWWVYNRPKFDIISWIKWTIKSHNRCYLIRTL